MSKKKNKDKYRIIDNPIKEEYFRFGNFITITIIAIWAVIAFNNYFKSQTIALQYLNIPDVFLFLKRIFQVIAEGLTSILWMAGLSFIAYRLGEKTLNLFKVEITSLEKFLFSTGLGTGILSYLTLLAGFAGFYYQLHFKVVFFILLVLSLWKYKPNFNFSFLNNYHFSLNEILMILLIGLLASISFIIALTPENFYDALVYHLSVPNFYILHHKIMPMDYLMHSNFPLNINMLYTLALLLNNEILARMIHFYLTFLTAITIFAVGKRFYNITVGLIAALIYYSIPIVLVNSWGCGNDAGLSFFFGLAIFSLLLWINTNLSSTFYLSAIYIGLTMASKYTALILFFVLNILIIVYLIKSEKDFIKIAKRIFIYDFIAFLFLLPYFIKNYIFTGNPVFPFLFKMFGGKNLYNYGGGGDIISTPLNLFSFKLIELLKSFWTQTISPLEPQNFIGIIFLIFLPFLVLAKNVEHKLLYLAGTFVLTYPLWYLGTPLFRYLMPAFIPLSIFIAFYIEKLKKNWIINSIFYISIFTAISLSLNIAWGLKLEPYLYRNSDKDEFLSLTRVNYPNPPYLVIKWINKNLPENSKVLFSGENKTFYIERDYLTYSVENNLQPLMEYIKQSNTPEKLHELLKKEGITHILINYREAIRVNPSYKTYYWNERDRKIFDEFWQKYIKLEYFKSGVYLYSFAGNNGKKEVNILEELEKKGWDIKNLHKIFEENKMWASLIDEYEDLARLGYDVQKQLEILKNLLEKEKK